MTSRVMSVKIFVGCYQWKSPCCLGLVYLRSRVVEADLAECDDLLVLQHAAHAFLDSVVEQAGFLRVHAHCTVYHGLVHQRQELLPCGQIIPRDPSFIQSHRARKLRLRQGGCSHSMLKQQQKQIMNIFPVVLYTLQCCLHVLCGRGVP